MATVHLPTSTSTNSSEGSSSTGNLDPSVVYTALKQTEEGFQMYINTSTPSFSTYVASLTRSIGAQARATFLTTIKRLPLERLPGRNDDKLKTELKCRYSVNLVELVEALAEILSQKVPIPSPEEIRFKVWALATHLLFRPEIIPPSLLKQDLESLVEPEYLKIAKESDPDIEKAKVRRNVKTNQNPLNGFDRHPLLYTTLFLTSIRVGCRACIECRQKMVHNTNLKTEIRRDIHLDTVKITKSWFSAINDIEKVVLYLSDTVLTSPDLDRISQPELFVAASIQAAFYSMKMKISGEAKKIVDSAWKDLFSHLKPEEITAGADIFLRATFNTTDKELAAHLFNYEQTQYNKSGNSKDVAVK